MSSSILVIGNSFSVDTMQHVGKIMRKLGQKKLTLATLYVGGCSVNMHLSNALENKPEYTLYLNKGTGWSEKPEVTVSEALKSRRWDWVVIQSGTGDGSRNTSDESLKNLPALVDWVKNNLDYPVKIAFNMTWVGEPWHTHPEIASYGGDVDKMYLLICGVMARLKQSGVVDYVCPTGAAIQLFKKSGAEGQLYRDGYHLSLGLGRFVAGLCFAYGVLGLSVQELEWQPQGVTEQQRKAAIKCAVEAVNATFTA